VVGSASGRGWIGYISSASRATFGSLGRAGGGLSFARTTAAAQQPMSLVGSELLYHLPDVSGKPGALQAAPLLANGTVGAPRALPDDPEKLPPQELDPVVEGAVRVGDRFVSILTGAKSLGISRARSYLWACCSATGELSDLTRLIPQRPALMFWQVGLDAKGRIWVAWLERKGSAVLGSVKIVELNPATLAPRTPSALTFPDRGRSTSFRLACAALCRVVASQLDGSVLAWSPGDGSPARLASGTRETPATLLAAADCSGRLAAASIARRDVDFGKPSAREVWRIEVVRGDARGSHARSVASVDLPDGLNQTDPDRYSLYQFANATFVPGGLVYFAVYYGYKTPLLAGFLRSC
jgi:hypothetical protein